MMSLSLFSFFSLEASDEVEMFLFDEERPTRFYCRVTFPPRRRRSNRRIAQIFLLLFMLHS